MTAGATNFPTSLDTTTNLPLAATLAAIELDGDGTDEQVHSNWSGVVGGGLIALETKIGTGSSWPGAAGRLLVATSATASAWQNTGVDINGGTIDGITSLTVDADLAFTGAQAITTSAGDLTLNPGGDYVVVADGDGFLLGHTILAPTPALGNITNQIQGTALGDSSLLLSRRNAAASGAYLAFLKSRDAVLHDGTYGLVENDDDLGTIMFFADDGTDNISTAAYIIAAIDGVAAENNTPGRLMFGTSADGAQGGTERFRIECAGSMTTLGAATANVRAAGSAVFGGGIAFTDVLNAWVDDATHGNGTTTLYIGNQTITTASDVRLKTDIEDTQIDALDLVGRLRVVDHGWADSYGAHEAYNSRGRWTGIIAQEAINVVPFIINASGGENCPACRAGKPCSEHGDWFMQYEYLVPVLVKAVQELTAEVRELKGAA